MQTWDTAAAPCYSRFQLWTFAASKLYAVINDVVMVAAVAVVVVVVAAVTIVVMMMMMMMVMMVMVMVMVTGMQI